MHVRGRESLRDSALAPPFICFFSSTWACPMQIGLSQECCLFCLKSSLWSSDLPCLLATAILDSFPLFYLPNRHMGTESEGAASSGPSCAPSRGDHWVPCVSLLCTHSIDTKLFFGYFEQKKAACVNAALHLAFLSCVTSGSVSWPELSSRRAHCLSSVML